MQFIQKQYLLIEMSVESFDYIDQDEFLAID